MTWNLGLLFEIKGIHPWRLVLPSGRVGYAQKRGKEKLGRSLILKYVLYIPQLNCHSISVSMLLKEVKDIYTVSFTSSTCAIQEFLSKILKQVKNRICCTYSRKLHRHALISLLVLVAPKVGHPSDSIIKILPCISNSKHNSLCDICFRVKQSCESFSNSLNKASEIFSLIHCDIWGPYKNTSSWGC